MGGLAGAGGGVDGAGMASYVMFHSWLKDSVKTVPSADCVDSLQTWDGARKQKLDCQIGAQGYMMRGGAYGATTRIQCVLLSISMLSLVANPCTKALTS